MRPSTPLVGREGELAVVEAALARLAAGDGGEAMAVVGPAGIGKSRLLAELAQRAADGEQLVLSGSASELERDLPFGVFVDAIDEHLDRLEPHRLERLAGDVRVELARVFPALSGTSVDGPAATQDERYRTHRAVRTLLETLATRPLVLLLDDFHWTDSGSIELASALLRRPPAARVLLVLGYRPRQLPEPLTAELTRAERNGTLTRLELEPLSAEAAAELLGEDVPAAAVPGLIADSGGVPFYLEQLARVTAPAAVPGAGAPRALGSVPPLVLAALTEELGTLSEHARLALQGAAVAGDPFEPELAAAAAGVPEGEAIDAIDELLRFEFVRVTAVPRRFRFRHPLVRRAVYEAASAGWRLSAHERCARALAARGASAEVRAHHVERSGRQGDPAAVALLRAAGEQAADRAPGTAARWFAGALRLLPDTAPDAERVALLVPQARALAAVGLLRESHDALEEAVRRAPPDEPARKAQLAVECSRAERFIGVHEGANARLRAALDDVEPDSRQHVALLLELAIDGFYRVAFDSMHSWAARALAGAERLGDPALTAASRSMMVLAGAWTGDVAKADASIPQATALVDALSDDQLAERLDAAANLAAAELYLDRFPDAGRHAQRVMRVGRASHQTQLFPSMYAALSCALWMEGKLAEAADLLDGAVEAARLLNDDQGVAWTLFNRAAVATQMGDTEHAIELARESVELTADAEPGLISGHAEVWLAMALLEAGEPLRAIDHFLRGGGEEISLIPGGWRAVYLEGLAHARIEAGDLAGARRSAGHAQSCAEGVGLPLAACVSARAQARLALADGDPGRAAELALASAGSAEAAGARLEAARSRTLAGRALCEAGERDRAVTELSRAAEELGSMGARRAFGLAEQELRRAGGRVARQARPRPRGEGLDSLSVREREIAELTVDRLTNREIAARLFLSEKTIETHMRNIFHKLGVASRSEVAALADRVAHS